MVVFPLQCEAQLARPQSLLSQQENNVLLPSSGCVKNRTWCGLIVIRITKAKDDKKVLLQIKFHASY